MYSLLRVDLIQWETRLCVQFLVLKDEAIPSLCPQGYRELPDLGGTNPTWVSLQLVKFYYL